MLTSGRSGGTAPLLLTSVLDEVSGQLHAPASLPCRTEPPVAIVQEVGWLLEPVWKITFPLPEHEPPPSSTQPAAVTTDYYLQFKSLSHRKHNASPLQIAYDKLYARKRSLLILKIESIP
jgi:hypothetical protein